MLKLIKYDFIHSMRRILMGYGIFIIGCAIEPLLSRNYLNYTSSILQMFAIFIYPILLIGLVLMTLVSFYLNFDCSMFQKQGYFTLTLPFKTNQLFISKLIVSIIWLLIGVVVFIIGIGMMAIVRNIDSGVHYFSWFGNGITGISYYLLRNPLSCFMYCFNICVIMFFMITLVYFASTIVHTGLIHKYRGVVATIICLVLGIIVFSWSGSISLTSGSQIEKIPSIAILAISLLLSAATIYMLEHCLELD